MLEYTIRKFGDPVLRQRSSEVTEIDGRIADIATSMIPIMQKALGVGLAAPQVGIGKRLFVYDSIDEGYQTIINPKIIESDGENMWEEGCLSLPGITLEVLRPAQVHLIGRNLDGNEISIEADEIEARVFQHELDHLDGILMFDRLERDERKAILARLNKGNINEETSQTLLIDSSFYSYQRAVDFLQNDTKSVNLCL